MSWQDEPKGPRRVRKRVLVGLLAALLAGSVAAGLLPPGANELLAPVLVAL